MFLLSVIFEGRLKDSTANLALVYYLLLQDRVSDAKKLYSKVESEVKRKHQLQSDYIDCYLDMYSGSEGNSYNTARKLSEKYKDYPVPSWRKLFLEVY